MKEWEKQNKKEEKGLWRWMLSAFPGFWAGEIWIFLLLFLFGGKWEKIIDSEGIKWEFLPDSKVFLGAIIVSLILGLSILFLGRSFDEKNK